MRVDELRRCASREGVRVEKMCELRSMCELRRSASREGVRTREGSAS